MELEPIVVHFPLRGEWTAYHTPADKVPSHGTDQLGQRFAYDFVRIDKEHEGWKFCRTSMRRYHFLGAPLENFYAWGAPIHAPFDARVVAASDGWSERNPVHFVRDLAVVLKNAVTFDPKRADALRMVLGNYIVLKMAGPDVYALIAHARTGSVRCREGADVRLGEHLADVGHSGNSTAPHLHFQLMDRPDLLQAVGLPCAFQNYEALRNGEWSSVTAGMPGKREFVRHVS
jgi:hypothetical protein